jgi:hypothetical protein
MMFEGLNLEDSAGDALRTLLQSRRNEKSICKKKAEHLQEKLKDDIE